MDESTPTSDIAKHIRWAGGSLGLSLTTIQIEDGVSVFFTVEEWSSPSANSRSKYLCIGVHACVGHRQFIMAKSDYTDDIDGRTFK